MATMPGQRAQQAQSVAVPTRLPIAPQPQNRDDDTNKDSKLVNGYLESGGQKGDYHLYKRPGLLVHTTKSGTGLGIYNWRGDIYSIFGQDIYKNGVSIYAAADDTNGVYRFSETLGGTPYLVFGNGVAAYTYDGVTVAPIADGDFPAAFVKGWAFLDATTYVMDAEANIFGSELSDPTSWDPTNVITAQIEPDGGVALAKQLVYVVALKQWNYEVFYDAASPTGTPLGKVEGAKGQYGCVDAETVQNIDDALYWVATTRAGSLMVVRMEGLQTKKISTKAIDRLLEQGTYGFDDVFSWQIRIRGHMFYCVTIISLNLTLVYDTDEALWYQWADTDENYMPICSSTWTSDRDRLVQHATNGKIYTMGDYVNDDGDLITVDIVTPIFDAGVRSRRKHLKIMEFVADQTPGSILQVRNNDYDYNPRKWTNFREVELSGTAPRILDEGTFYKRAYNFRHRCNTHFRMEGIELQLDIGTG